MELKQLGVDNDGLFEFRDPSRGLVIRGQHPEWVLQAAADIIGDFSRLAAESLVEEMTALHGLGAVRSADLASARAEKRRRFDTRPRCSVALGAVEYFWTMADTLTPPQRATPEPLTLLPEMRVGHPDASPHNRTALQRSQGQAFNF